MGVLKGSESFSAQQLLHTIKQKAPPTGRFLLALSGGVDSMALLHALADIRQQLLPAKIAAVHVDHQLHPHSSAWTDHCRCACETLSVPYQALVVDISPGNGPEASARDARYTAIAGLMQSGDVLLSAHHLDDQAETLILNLMRGSGSRGLAGMPALRPFTHGWLMRPLLDVSRQQLVDYARSLELEWIEDPSNLDQNLDRNFVRHSLIPLMRQRWPAASDMLAVSAGHLYESNMLLEEYLTDELRTCVDPRGGLSLSGLFQHKPAIQAMLIRQWCQSNGLAPLPRARIQEFVSQLQADGDRVPMLSWDQHQLARHSGRLLLHPELPIHDNCWRMQWSGDEPLQLPSDLGLLTSIDGRFQEAVEVGFRTGGERLLQSGMHRELKGVLQQLDIPAWLRVRVPLLYNDGDLIAVADLRNADGSGIRVAWERGSGWPLG